MERALENLLYASRRVLVRLSLVGMALVGGPACW